MKAKFGAIVVGGSGKLGGHVVTKNRQGYAFRTKVTPINRRSNSQQGVRNTFTILTQGWRALTAAQRAAWEAAAPDFVKTNIFGDKYSPTGKNLYTLVNENLLLVGSAVVSTPPAATAPTALTALTILVNSSTVQTWTIAATPTAAGTVLLVYQTRPLSAGVSSAGARYRLTTTIAAATATGFSTFTAYSAKFGAPVTGKKIFTKMIPINSTSGIRGTALGASGVTT
jgi:hypothetical protein